MISPLTRLFTGTIPAALAQSGLMASVLVPYRSLADAAEIASDPSRRESFFPSTAAPVAVAAQLASNLSHRIFESVEFLKDRLLGQGPRITPGCQDTVDGHLHYLFAGDELEEDFSPHLFRNLNLRGIEGYDIEFFGWDPLSIRGFHVEKHERTIGRMIKRLRFGAVLADWGGGAGVFASEARGLRPDLRIYVNDLHPLEDILAHSELPRDMDPRDLEKGITRLTGDAMTCELPKRQQADLLVSCLLTPYLADPLKLIAHMYNQLKPGGILITTFPSKVFDAGRMDLSGDHIFSQVVWDLRHQAIDVESPKKDQILVVRRADDRRMEIAASHVKGRLTEFTLNWGGRSREIRQYLSYYKPQYDPPHRWFQVS